MSFKGHWFDIFSSCGKIAALILGIIILIVVVWGAIIAFKKPSVKDALTAAADTKITTARVNVKTTNAKSKMYSNYVVGPNNAIHITMKSVPKSDTNLIIDYFVLLVLFWCLQH